MTLPPMTFSSATSAEPRCRPHDDPAAGQALADVVVGVALEPQRDAGAAGTRRSYCPADPVKVRSIVPSGEALPGALGDLVAEHRADGAVDVADREPRADRLAVVDGVAAAAMQLVVEGLLEAVVLGDRVVGARAVGAVHLGEDRAQVETDAFQWVIALGCRGS